jgi:hypothetical protein
MAREAGPDFSAEWPREESNLRARIRSPSLYPLSYGAVRSRVPRLRAKLSTRRRALPGSAHRRSPSVAEPMKAEAEGRLSAGGRSIR